MRYSSSKSFTLVEMLIVIVVIGILMTALVPRLIGAKNKAEYRARQMECRNDCQEALLNDDNFNIGACLEYCVNLCDKPDITIENYTIMACNVGTSIAGIGPESYGKYFVWGSNVPIPENYTISRTDWGKGDGFATEKERKGPCPIGYHLPNKDERDEVATSFGNFNTMLATLFLPRAGYMYPNQNYHYSQGGAFYWSSSLNSNAGCSLYNGLSITCNHNRLDGNQIRCFKNTN